MLLAHKIELRPTVEQIQYLDMACGHRRHCYNQLLAHFSQKGNKWSKAAGYQYFMKVIRPAFPWYNEVSSRVTRNAIDDLDNAFRHFFRRVKTGQKPGFPRFKRRGVRDSFALREAEKFDADGRELRIEKLKTKIKMRQRVRFTGKAKQVTISKRAGKYFASILVDTNEYDPHDYNREAVGGVDLGIKELAVISNGTIFPANQCLKSNLNRLARLQRQLARKKKGSNRRAKAKSRVVKLHFQVARQRSAALHAVSDYLTKTFDTIVIEDLNIKGMVKNHNLARAISDCGWGTLRQQIEYKALLRNCNVIIADRFFPSSKMCSGCGQLKNDLTLSDRVYSCDCGVNMDRDLNAANNLKEYGRHALQGDPKRTKESC